MELFVIDDTDEKKIVEIKKGLKVDVDENVLKQIQDEKYITDNFKLNIKRINRWLYSVYFDDKPDKSIE